jgi:hypothetical protein
MIPEGMAQHVADAHLFQQQQQQQQAAASASHNSGSSSRHSSSSAVPATQFLAPHGHGRGKGGKGLWLASTVPKIETVPAAMLAAAGVPTLNTQATFRSVAAAAGGLGDPYAPMEPYLAAASGLIGSAAAAAGDLGDPYAPMEPYSTAAGGFVALPAQLQPQLQHFSFHTATQLNTAAAGLTNGWYDSIPLVKHSPRRGSSPAPGAGAAAAEPGAAAGARGSSSGSDTDRLSPGPAPITAAAAAAAAGAGVTAEASAEDNEQHNDQAEQGGAPRPKRVKKIVKKQQSDVPVAQSHMRRNTYLAPFSGMVVGTHQTFNICQHGKAPEGQQH